MNPTERLTDRQREAVEDFRKRHRTGVLALLFTDVVGSTGLKQQLGDAAGTELIQRHQASIRELLSGYSEAEEISTAGDSFFIVFVKPSDAVRFALRLEVGSRRTGEGPDVSIEARVGIHMGEVFIEEKGTGAIERDVLGVQVDTAARVMALAAGRQILMTRSVFDNARTILTGETLPGIETLSWVNHGPYLLKGLHEAIEICEVGERTGAAMRTPADCEAGKRAVVPGSEPVLGWRPAVNQDVPNTQWTLERQLGEGGFGEVWVARHQRTKEPRVFKFCFRADRLRNLKREMTLFRILKEELGSREDIARLVEVQFDEAPYYLVFEYTGGGSLSEWAESHGGLDNVPREQRLEIVAQVAEALGAAHSAGIIHKDVKPSNVLVEERKDGSLQARLTDFGIGQLMDRQIVARAGITLTGFTETASAPSETSSRSGTRLYMAPELIEGKEPTAAADVYALGVLLYQVVYGELARAVAPGWERNVEDELLREDIALCVDHQPDLRLADASELAERLRSLEKRRAGRIAERRAEEIATRRRKQRKTLAIAIPVVVVIAGLGSLAVLLYQRNVKARILREETIPEITRLIQEQDFFRAYHLAVPVASHISDELWSQMTRPVSIATSPPGASVSYREWDSEDGWIRLGVTPYEDNRFPKGVFRWRFEKEGYKAVEIAQRQEKFRVVLTPLDHRYPEMIWIPAGQFGANIGGLRHLPEIKAPAYWIDRCEVTNGAFKEFVDAGGYRNREFWKHEFVDDDRRLSWEDAMARFRDSTERPGPATWKGGTYPDGQKDHPVCGVSWYEAAAYAEFRGKSLPTVYHWAHAATVNYAAVIVPLSNFGDQGAAPVGQYRGVGPRGLYDMAGNVKEWCFNAADDGEKRRYILGGSWGEPTYLFTDRDLRNPMDRSIAYGFRCADYPAGEDSLPRSMMAAIPPRPRRDYAKEKPVDDQRFESFLDYFKYDELKLNAKEEKLPDDSPYWRMERITFPAAYGGEQMIVYIFFPKGAKPPYQPVLFFPGSGARDEHSLDTMDQPALVEFIIHSGRALVYPIYKGTYERRVEDESSFWSGPIANRDYFIQVVKDLRLSIDYLETREDMDLDKLAYYGFSWGGVWGPVILAVETRIKVGILLAGGFPGEYPRPEVDAINYASRVEIPVLMINGKEDVIFPYETSQKPMFKALGTPAEHKKHIVYPGGHGLFGLIAKQIRKDVLGFLDQYFGPVK